MDTDLKRVATDSNRAPPGTVIEITGGGFCKDSRLTKRPLIRHQLAHKLIEICPQEIGAIVLIDARRPTGCSKIAPGALVLRSIAVSLTDGAHCWRSAVERSFGACAVRVHS